MTQANPNSQPAPEGTNPEQAKPTRPRRARRPANHGKAPNRTEAASAAAPEAVAMPRAETPPAAHTAQPAATEQIAAAAASAPARPRRRRPAQRPAEAQPPLPAPAQPVAALPAPQEPQGQGQPQAAAPRKRTTRGHRGGRKNEVQLVKPATPPLTEAEQHAAAEEAHAGMAPPTAFAAEATEAAARVVPVVTAHTPVTASEPAAPASRFRFGRRSSAVAEPEARSERISRVPEEPQPDAAAPLSEAQHEPEAPSALATTDADQAETWQAQVARVAPETVMRTAAADARDEGAVEDLVTALGLTQTQTRANVRSTGEAVATPADAEVEADTTAERAAESEAEGETDAEGQPGSRRRRRRRRSPSAASSAASNAITDAEAPVVAATPVVAAPEWPSEREMRNGYDRVAEVSPFEQPYSPYNRPQRERFQPVIQPERSGEGVFGSPEPQMARGFGPQPRGVAAPAPTAFQRPTRERGVDVPPMSPNQLGAMVTHAIQQQTDRLLGELRYQPQVPSMTVAVPLPSTERVGVFVDVANVVYSARNLRIHLDFGRLLEFLRGNRRLIRAQAYAPTNPEPGAEQTFLTPVRGQGYRITTKNYKTFASGAKKADMDLDLCMDVVRMVDARAVDTILLVSGDSDFLPLLEYASDRGVRVEVAAFDDAAAMILRQSCDLFINLSLVEGIQR
ncbi:MAG: NYN domain-containing protein [Ktedonobacterales bacterium]